MTRASKFVDFLKQRKQAWKARNQDELICFFTLLCEESKLAQACLLCFRKQMNSPWSCVFLLPIWLLRLLALLSWLRSRPTLHIWLLDSLAHTIKLYCRIGGESEPAFHAYLGSKLARAPRLSMNLNCPSFVSFHLPFSGLYSELKISCTAHLSLKLA